MSPKLSIITVTGNSSTVNFLIASVPKSGNGTISSCIILFAINAPAAVIGTTVESAAEAIRTLGFVVTPEALTLLAQEAGESTILSRTGGAPTFAIGMAHIITEIFNNRSMMAFWYHFAILF